MCSISIGRARCLETQENEIHSSSPATLNESELYKDSLKMKQRASGTVIKIKNKTKKTTITFTYLVLIPLLK